ncbi:TonB-dependent receptor plug domain-containing protein [Methylomusa anaerophila]|uniref:Vitamin B12 transporter BtuB n=2 Tax=Methylomusa anaerophila TaxID=1930071 RepID=A0A348AL92_9FIRM|nr:TonB-dependent receptor [Methylomusa anaerophila]BBB91840.1 vitamin B12 transporter BtuB precursor [Methylomusa anaerophila]
MKWQCNKALLSLLLVGAACGGGSETCAEEIFDLDQIVVTATRTQVEEFKANANISVITREQIERNHYTNLTDALRNVPGVFIANYGATGESSASNNLMLNGSSNIVVLIDGQRANINGSSGTYGKMAMAEISNMDSIERIEILKSSASTLYGSDAQGGVINIITRKPEDGKTTTKITTTLGSYDREQYNISHRGSVNGFFWDISGQKKLQGDFKDGWGRTVRDRINVTNNSFKIGKKFADKADVTVVYQTYEAEYTATNGGYSKPSIVQGTKDNSKLTITYTQKISDKMSNQLAFFRHTNKAQESDYTKFNDFTTTGFSDQFTYAAGETHTIIGGLDYYEDKINHYKNSSATTDGEKISNKAVYIQDEWQITKEWKLSSGIRFDDQSRYGRNNTPSFVLGYTPNGRMNVYAGYKQFFTAPYVAHLYSATYGNPDLKAETGHAVEAGINYKFDATFVGSLHVFKRDSENVVAYVDTPTPTHPKGQYVNIDEEHARGVTIQLKKAFSDRFNTNVGYSYLYIKPNAGQTPNRNGALPRGSWNLELNYVQDKFDAVISGRGTVGKGQQRADNQTIGKPYRTYWIWDVAMNYKTTDMINIFARVNNIFDTMYTDMSYELNPNSAWFSAPGRNFQVGVEYTF